jgi:hypothetical protein
MQRIFISHRNGEADVRALIEQLQQQLARAGYDVLVDFDRLQAGAELRNDIYTWLGVCHGAVVFLSPDALSEQSVWVPTESSILSWRKTLDPAFVLIPVLLPGVGLDDLRVHLRYRDLGLHDLVCVTHRDADTTCTEVLSGLQRLVPAARAPLEDLAEQIEVLLGGVRDEFLDEAVRLAGAEPRRLPRGMVHARSAALAMLQAPLLDTVAALEYLAPRLPSAVDVDRILEIVAPGWVDLNAARWIAYCAQAPTPRPAAVVNAKTRFGAEMYVRRACCRSPKTMWRVVSVTGVHGEAVFADLAAEIQAALYAEFASALVDDPFGGGAEQQLMPVLQALQKRGRPVVVALRLPGGHVELLPSLQERFPYLTFLFLSGPTLPAEECPITLLRPVEPLLPEGREDAAFTDYQTARSLLRPAQRTAGP